MVGCRVCGDPTNCPCGCCCDCCGNDRCEQLELETFDADELGLDPEEPWDA